MAMATVAVAVAAGGVRSSAQDRDVLHAGRTSRPAYEGWEENTS